MYTVVKEVANELWSLVQKRPRLRAALGLMAAMVAIQCVVLTAKWVMSDPIADLYSISGSVSIDGQSPKSGFVSFFPKQGRASVGIIKPNGTYSLFAAAGDYAVVIEAKELLFNGKHESEFSEEERRSFPPSATQVRWLVPEQYLNQARTPLTISVTRRQSGVDFVIRN